MNLNLDANGLIVQTNGDGGDCAGREGDYWTLTALNNILNDIHTLSIMDPAGFKNALNLLQINNQWVRYPHPPYNDPKDFSRDQARPLVIATGLWDLPVPSFGSTYPNGDVKSPQHKGEEIRAKKQWYYYPYLLVGDSFMLLDVCIVSFWKARNPGPIRKWFGKHISYSFVQDYKGDPNNPDSWSVHGDTNVGDDINLTLSIAQAQYQYPTPISWFARKIYKTFRPHGIQYAWNYYFRPETGANPFDELAKSVIKEF